MNLDGKLIEALNQHTKYLQELTEYIRNDLVACVNEIQAEKARNYQHLVLILGYTAYFATWYQVREVFLKSFMGFSYVFMIFSLFFTILSLIVPYSMKLIKDDFKYRVGYVRYLDLIALGCGFISILLIVLASIVLLFKYMCFCSIYL
jgi:hypothetical protein